MTKFKAGDRVRVLPGMGHYLSSPRRLVKDGDILTVSLCQWSHGIGPSQYWLNFVEGFGGFASRVELVNDTDDTTANPLWTADPLWTAAQGNAIAECATESQNEADLAHFKANELAAEAFDLHRKAAQLRAFARLANDINFAGVDFVSLRVKAHDLSVEGNKRQALAEELFAEANHLKARGEALDSLWD